MDRKATAFLLLALGAFLAQAGCETPPPYVPEWVMERSEYGRRSSLDRRIEGKYEDFLFEEQGRYTGVEGDPRATRQQLINLVRKKYAREAITTLYSVIVGQPPHENKVGYVETLEYPQVMIYDRDMGVYDPIRLLMHYIYDLDLEEPRGFITESGLTVRFKRPEELDDSKLGYFTPGIGAVYVLGVCPSTGCILNPDWLFNQMRTDIDENNINNLKKISALEVNRHHQYYRLVKDLDPSFHRSIHGFMPVEDSKRKDFGFRSMIPVRLQELRARDFHGKGADRAELKPVETGGGSGEGDGEEDEE
jgi:hypothetical protein